MTESVNIEDVILYAQEKVDDWQSLKVSVPYSMMCATLKNIIIDLETICERGVV